MIRFTAIVGKSMSELVLHPQNLLRVPLRGRRLVARVEERAQEVRRLIIAQPPKTSVGVTVLIRTKNDAASIGQLLEDIRANQEYFSGPVQVVLVDTESSDDTLKIAERYKDFFELTVVPIKQAAFDYATSLNVGFKAAKFPLVFTLVGHSSFTNRLTLATAALYVDRPDFAGGFCYTMPNSNASMSERLVMGFHTPAKMLNKPARPLKKEVMGMMGANCSLVRREVWQKLGGYDVRYAAGGEDADFGHRALRAGYKIMVDPVLTVYHTHGLGLIGNIRQLQYWHKLDRPRPFNAAELAKFRSDLRA